MYNKRLRGPFVVTMNRIAPKSLHEAKASAISVWGDRVEEFVLEEWAIEWWSKRNSSGDTRKPRQGKQAAREITLSDLKLAGKLEELMLRLELATTDVSAIVDIVDSLNGISVALDALTALRDLRAGAPLEGEPEPCLFGDLRIPRL